MGYSVVKLTPDHLATMTGLLFREFGDRGLGELGIGTFRM